MPTPETLNSLHVSSLLCSSLSTLLNSFNVCVRYVVFMRKAFTYLVKEKYNEYLDGLWWGLCGKAESQTSLCMCVCKQILMHHEEGHYGCFWRKVNGWLTGLGWKQASSGAPSALYHMQLGHRQNFKGSLCAACLGSIARTVAHTQGTFTSIRKGVFSFRVQSSTRASGLVSGGLRSSRARASHQCRATREDFFKTPRPPSFREWWPPLSEGTETSVMTVGVWLLCIGSLQPLSGFRWS